MARTPVFVPTQWDTAQLKERFFRTLLTFIEQGFPQKLFSQQLYGRLHLTFGFIAHYDRGGFWATYFTSPDAKVRFLEKILSWSCVGDPAWTYSDVEREVQKRLRASGVLERLRAEATAAHEQAELAELARLQKKYGDARRTGLVP